MVLKDLPEKTVIIDCGANIGDISLLFAKKKAKVHAFEPDPLAFKVLKKRTKGISNITCYEEAVGTSNGSTRFYFHKDRARLNHEAFSVSTSAIAEKENIDPTNFQVCPI